MAPEIAKVEPLHRDSEDRFDPDPERSYTLKGRYYTDPGIFEQEKHLIFYRTWNFVGHVEQVPEPGCYFECSVLDQNLFVVRGKDGEIRAFYNVCQHRAHELVKGSGKAKAIVCPYHAWSYRLDCSLRTARHSEHTPGFDASAICLTPVRVEVFCNFIFVNLDPDAEPLAGQLGPMEEEVRRYCPDLDRLTFAHRKTYEIKANWKNVVDNFLECYHCAPAHPAFVDLVEMKSYRSVTYDIHSSHISTGVRAANKAYSLDREGLRQDAFAAWWLWPNVTINTFPGAGNITVLHIMPTGPETVYEHFDFYFLKDTPSEREMEAIRYLDEVLQPEDIGLVESVQRGLNSRGYDQGRFIVDRERSELSEHAVHHFHSLVHQALNQAGPRRSPTA